jgi:hypothetical protein
MVGTAKTKKRKTKTAAAKKALHYGSVPVYINQQCWRTIPKCKVTKTLHYFSVQRASDATRTQFKKNSKGE